MGKVLTVSLKALRLDGDTQSRVAIDEAVVDDYAESMKAGVKFPPVIAFGDGHSKWLTDGFHRYHGRVKAGFEEIEVEIRDGTQRDARLFAVGANAAHGLRRTNADKRKAALTLLTDAEWRRWSDGEIAKKCGVSDRFVGQLRNELSPKDSEMERMATRNGTVYSVNVSKIGKANATAPFETTVAEVKSAPDTCLEIDLDVGPDGKRINWPVPEHLKRLDPDAELNFALYTDYPWVALPKDIPTGGNIYGMLISVPHTMVQERALEELVEHIHKLKKLSLVVSWELRHLLKNPNATEQTLPGTTTDSGSCAGTNPSFSDGKISSGRSKGRKKKSVEASYDDNGEE